MSDVPILPKYRADEEKELVLLGGKGIFGLDEAALTAVKEIPEQGITAGMIRMRQLQSGLNPDSSIEPRTIVGAQFIAR